MSKGQISIESGEEMIKKLFVVAVGMMLMGMVGCSQDEREAATDKAKESMDKAVEVTKEAAGDVVDATKEATHEASEATKEAADGAKKAME